MNTYGAAKRFPGQAEEGAILRDHNGVMISGLVADFGVYSAFKAKLLVLAKGLELARDLKVDKLVV